MSYLRYSIVIPAFNEERRLPATLDRILSEIPDRATPSEIIVIDDGSTDNTAQAVIEYRRDFSRVKLVRQPVNTGKGAAVRRGLMLARGDLILVTDADLNDAFSQFWKLVRAIRDGADVAIASRWSTESEAQDTPAVRRLGSWLFRGLFHSVLGLQQQDTQCGMKVITRAAARSALPYLTTNRWCWDAELLLIASRLGFHISEVPIRLVHDYGLSKFQPVRDGIRSLREVGQIAWRSWRGMYPVPDYVPSRVPALRGVRLAESVDQEVA